MFPVPMYIIVGMVLVLAAAVIGGVYYAGWVRPERQRRHERRTIRSGLIKNEYKILKDFPIDLQEKSLTVGYGKTTRTFIYDICKRGWMLYEESPETRETKILAAELFNDAVRAIYGVDDAIAIGTGWEAPAHKFEPEAELAPQRRWRLQRPVARTELLEPEQMELERPPVAELTRAS